MAKYEQTKVMICHFLSFKYVEFCIRGKQTLHRGEVLMVYFVILDNFNKSRHCLSGRVL